MRNRLRRTITLAGSLAFLATVAGADTPARIRGTVTGVEGRTLTVKTRTEDAVSITLSEGWAASGIVKATAADIKPGVFVGTASAATEKDVDDLQALELVIFPESMRGTGEGHYGWDLAPGSTMTNATVAAKVEGVKGHTLTLSYAGGQKKVTLPADVPIVTFAPASPADVKPGAAVFVPAQRKDDGTLAASRVLVGKDGVVPPM